MRATSLDVPLDGAFDYDGTFTYDSTSYADIQVTCAEYSPGLSASRVEIRSRAALVVNRGRL